MNNLRDVAFELSHGLYEIGAELTNIEDVEVLLGNLMNDMGVSATTDNICIVNAFKEHHRMVRVLWSVLHQSIKEVRSIHEKLNQNQETLFDGLVRNDEGHGDKQ